MTKISKNFNYKFGIKIQTNKLKILLSTNKINIVHI